jgi:hypothetical protein
MSCSVGIGANKARFAIIEVVRHLGNPATKKSSTGPRLLAGIFNFSSKHWSKGISKTDLKCDVLFFTHSIFTWQYNLNFAGHFF